LAVENPSPKSGHGAPGLVLDKDSFVSDFKNKGIASGDAGGLSPPSMRFPKQQVFQVDQVDQVEQVEQVDQGAWFVNNSFLLCDYFKDNNLTITKLPLFQIFYLVMDELVSGFLTSLGA
jgi:hypothetical protein